MYTHELADALRKLASALKSGPNIQIGELSSLFNAPVESSYFSQKQRRSGDIPIALNALLSLSKIDKKEWVGLIDELNLDVDIRPRDASRDIMGKVLKILEINPDARFRLENQVNSKDGRASPELARALSALLAK